MRVRWKSSKSLGLALAEEVIPVIADTDGDRALLQQMVVDACSSGMIDVAVFLMKLVVKDRAAGAYGASDDLPAEVTSALEQIVCEDGWRGIEAVEARMDQLVVSSMVKSCSYSD